MTTLTTDVQDVIERHRELIKNKIAIIADQARREGFSKLQQTLAQETPETRTFIILFEALVSHGVTWEKALEAVGEYLRDGVPLTADEMLLIQKRNREWYEAWKVACEKFSTIPIKELVPSINV